MKDGAKGHTDLCAVFVFCYRVWRGETEIFPPQLTPSSAEATATGRRSFRRSCRAETANCQLTTVIYLTSTTSPVSTTTSPLTVSNWAT